MTPSKIRKEHDLKCRGVNPVQGPDRCWVSFQKCNSPLLLARVSQTSLVFKPDSYFDFDQAAVFFSLRRSLTVLFLLFAKQFAERRRRPVALCVSVPTSRGKRGELLALSALLLPRKNWCGRGRVQNRARGSRPDSSVAAAAGRRCPDVRWLGVGYR
jgi:hypothetical protein